MFIKYTLEFRGLSRKGVAEETRILRNLSAIYGGQNVSYIDDFSTSLALYHVPPELCGWPEQLGGLLYRNSCLRSTPDPALYRT
jgi:hypothetical protein